MVWMSLYVIIISLITFIIFGADKKRARRHEWRIPEKVLFMLAIIGGSIGAMIGMIAFHHKTKKWYFKIGMPLILAVQSVIVWAAFRFIL